MDDDVARTCERAPVCLVVTDHGKPLQNSRALDENRTWIVDTPRPRRVAFAGTDASVITRTAQDPVACDKEKSNDASEADFGASKTKLHVDTIPEEPREQPSSFPNVPSWGPAASRFFDSGSKWFATSPEVDKNIAPSSLNEERSGGSILNQWLGNAKNIMGAAKPLAKRARAGIGGLSAAAAALQLPVDERAAANLVAGFTGYEGVGGNGRPGAGVAANTMPAQRSASSSDEPTHDVNHGVDALPVAERDSDTQASVTTSGCHYESAGSQNVLAAALRNRGGAERAGKPLASSVSDIGDVPRYPGDEHVECNTLDPRQSRAREILPMAPLDLSACSASQSLVPPSTKASVKVPKLKLNLADMSQDSVQRPPLIPSGVAPCKSARGHSHCSPLVSRPRRAPMSARGSRASGSVYGNGSMSARGPRSARGPGKDTKGTLLTTSGIGRAPLTARGSSFFGQLEEFLNRGDLSSRRSSGAHLTSSPSRSPMQLPGDKHDTSRTKGSATLSGGAPRKTNSCVIELTSDNDDDDDDSELGPEPDFGGWLTERVPMFRFERASAGLAWEFPLSKDEKRELLLLSLDAEGAELRAQVTWMHENCTMPLAAG